MRIITVLLALVVGIPLAFIALSVTLGLMTALVGLAIRVAIVGLCLYGGFRLAAALLGGGKRKSVPPAPEALPTPVDPYYEAAKRELDRELGTR